MPTILIDFIRHGEPVGGRRYRGSGVDDPLSEVGWQQMWQAVGELRLEVKLITSPLRRCHEFAAALAQRDGLTLVLEERFREIGVGAWEGLTPDEVRTKDPAAYARYYSDPVRGQPEGAESLEDLLARVSNAYRELCFQHPDQHVLVVAHAGVIRAMLGHVLKADPNAWYSAQVDYAGITRFRHGAHGNRLEFHNRRIFTQAAIPKM